MSKEVDKVQFIASIPALQSAITISGNGDGARVKLDIPESDLAAALRLLTMRGMAVKVTVEPESHG